jgi:N-methylhydantoinase B/oxoprolinase/acetone carboxylase alpha subunit
MLCGEVSRRVSPLFFHEKRMIPGSGGAGKFRGGLGQEMRIENESPTPIAMSFKAERTTYPAPGLAGGRPGGAATCGSTASASTTRLWPLPTHDKCVD